MYDMTSTNGHSEDYYQVPLKKNLKLEKKKKLQRNIQHTREIKKIRQRERKERPVAVQEALEL